LDGAGAILYPTSITVACNNPRCDTGDRRRRYAKMTVEIQQAGSREKWFEDLKECSTLNSKDEETIRDCMKYCPFLWRGMVNDNVACVWGLAPATILSDKAYIWLYTTKYADEHPFLLVRYSQIMMEHMLKQFSLIVGHTQAENTRAIKWLKWLGAEFGFPNGKYIPFTIRRK